MMEAHLVAVHQGVGVVAVVGVPAPVEHHHPQRARHEHNDEQPRNMNIYTAILTSNYIETVDGNSANKPDIKMSEVSHIPLFFYYNGPLCLITWSCCSWRTGDSAWRGTPPAPGRCPGTYKIFLECFQIFFTSTAKFVTCNGCTEQLQLIQFTTCSICSNQHFQHLKHKITLNCNAMFEDSGRSISVYGGYIILQ